MNPYDILLPLGIILPLLSGTAFFFFGWLFEEERAALATLVVLATLLTLAGQIALAIGTLWLGNTPFATLFTWSPLAEARVQMAFRADSLSLFFGIPVAVLAFLVAIYLVARQPSAEEDDGIMGGRLYGLILLAEGAALGAFYSADLIWLYGWGELLGLSLYLLAGPGLRGASSQAGSFIAYSVSVFGGFLVLAPLLVIVSRNGGEAVYTKVSPSSIDTLLFGVALLGVGFKAAQFPLQSWIGRLSPLPSGAYVVAVGGGLLPLAIYLPSRLQYVAGERLNAFDAVSPYLLPVGALTIFGCGWLAAHEDDLRAKIAFLGAAQIGFAALSLGLGQQECTGWQLLGLWLSAPLLWLCADLMEIESLPPRRTGEKATPKVISRSPLFRFGLVLVYLVGGATTLGLPLTPAYLGRQQVLEGLLNGGNKIYLGLVLIGLLFMIAALGQGMALYLDSPRQTAEGRNRFAWINLFLPGLAAIASLALGFYPAVLNDWIGLFATPFTPITTVATGSWWGTGWLGLIAGIGAFILVLSYLSRPRLTESPVYNGGLLFGTEAEEERRRRDSQQTAIRKFQLPTGFDDDFFNTGFDNTTKPKQPAKSEPTPRLSPQDYFSGLGGSLEKFYRITDPGNVGGFFGGILLRVLRFINWLLELMIDKFYAALAALTVVGFIILLAS